MTHLTPQTRSFIWLIIIALLATYAALLLARDQKTQTLVIQPKAADTIHSDLPTENWPKYIDRAFPLEFKYPTGWEVSSNTSTPGYYNIAIDAPASSDQFNIYISDKDYFAMKGLKGTPVKLRGYNGINVTDMLIGISTGKYYYTFDAGLNQKLLPEFQAIVASVVFN